MLLHCFQNDPINFGPNQWGCPFCTKMSKTIAHAKQHIIIHTGEKPFRCNYCEHTANQKSNIQRHMKTHKNFWCLTVQLRIEIEKLFNCEFCQYSSNRKSNLQKHMKVKHENLLLVLLNVCLSSLRLILWFSSYPVIFLLSCDFPHIL